MIIYIKHINRQYERVERPHIPAYTRIRAKGSFYCSYCSFYKTDKTMNEKRLEKNLRTGVGKLGGLAIKFFSTWFTGMPDRLVLMPGGKVWFVELKSTGDALSPRQRLVRKILSRLGFEVWRIDTQELLNDFLQTIAK